LKLLLLQSRRTCDPEWVAESRFSETVLLLGFKTCKKKEESGLGQRK
jgi:hypothetical protein